MPQPNAKTDQEAAAPAAVATKPGAIELTINGELFLHTGAPDMPLLWYLRDVLRLTGSKYGCGVGQCGACTVHVEGKAQRSCLLPVSALAGQSITTIEGIGAADDLHAVQQAWMEEDVPQCGYCQAGQIMAAVDLLKRKAQPSDADIAQLTNICRCGTYPRIRKAVRRAAQLLATSTNPAGAKS
ncbi:isoquinoline 1-oxidoreductase alpha subunit [Tahibacter aquaticus]|uniref:Isoquinoline 1-oxidoreductase alpha subunit n=1 Tax=Tahibacter aquaticus TaxID=520092 RepID=A0A4R6YR25_9GAMM|nr:(2Fe-2S)-binding protein [Tahibacter aquaticus]TDR40425.1 isoquinoline 1-oxidoreductase alpha subunit [Tahibacter aquaticus]